MLKETYAAMTSRLSLCEKEYRERKRKTRTGVIGESNALRPISVP
jgi:hypothetical protein